MALLADYAITPDVLDVASYSNVKECAARLENIREAMLKEGLVRDLRDGEWKNVFESDERFWHRRGKELVKKLKTQGRLVPCAPARPFRPANDNDWCAEALASHEVRPLQGGVIVTEQVKREHAKERLVARIERLSSAAWWTARGPSVTVRRTATDYEKHLDLVLRYSNLIVLIDPYLDPKKPRYRQIGKLLSHAGNRKPAPKIEIHRACYKGSEHRHKPQMHGDAAYFERRFRSALGKTLRDTDLQIEVFLWDDFHDRYLISNIIGIALQNGFDTTDAPDTVTRWARLSRDDRDDVRREFQRSSRLHKPQGDFKIP